MAHKTLHRILLKTLLYAGIGLGVGIGIDLINPPSPHAFFGASFVGLVLGGLGGFIYGGITGVKGTIYVITTPDLTSTSIKSKQIIKNLKLNLLM